MIETLVVRAPKKAGLPSEDGWAIFQRGGKLVAIVVDGHGIYVDAKGNRQRDKSLVPLFTMEVVENIRSLIMEHVLAIRFLSIFNITADRVRHWQSQVDPRAKSGQQSVGACVSAVIVDDRWVHLAQAGDCRLYVSTGVGLGFRQLSEDHEISRGSERERLKPFLDKGTLEVESSYPRDRLLKPGSDNCPGRSLAVTRSFGDYFFDGAVTHEPECRRFDLVTHGEHELYALCSDGGNGIVEEVLEHVRGRARSAPWDEIEAMTSACLIDRGDDVTIIWFRKVPWP